MKREYAIESLLGNFDLPACQPKFRVTIEATGLVEDFNKYELEKIKTIAKEAIQDLEAIIADFKRINRSEE